MDELAWNTAFGVAMKAVSPITNCIEHHLLNSLIVKIYAYNNEK